MTGIDRFTDPAKIGQPVAWLRQPGRPPIGVNGLIAADVMPVALIYLGYVDDDPPTTWWGKLKERIVGRKQSPNWKLEGEFRYFDPVLNCTFVTPDGYQFDLASVPRALWAINPPFEYGTVPPLLHDCSYGRKGDMRKSTAGPLDPYTIPGVRLTRAMTDDLFLRLMLLDGIDPFKANAAYEAVHLFGGPVWAAHPEPVE